MEVHCYRGLEQNEIRGRCFKWLAGHFCLYKFLHVDRTSNSGFVGGGKVGVR
jgi:hypothetical protein